MLYDDKMKVIFNLKGEQQNELLLNLIFPDYPDGNDGENENSAKEKETANAISLSEGCAYTPVMVEMTGVEPVSKRGLTVLSSCEVQILNFSRCRLLHRLHFDEVLIYLSATHHWQKDLPILNDAALLSDRTTGATGSLITQRKPIDYYFLRLI